MDGWSPSGQNSMDLVVWYYYEGLLHQLLSLQQAPSLLTSHSDRWLGACSERPARGLITSLPCCYHTG